jgi:hypothetical protein
MNDMNIDIDENDCIVAETKGGEVGKRSAGSAGSQTPHRRPRQRAKPGGGEQDGGGGMGVDEGDEAEGKGKQQGEHQRASSKGCQSLYRSRRAGTQAEGRRRNYRAGRLAKRAGLQVLKAEDAQTPSSYNFLQVQEVVIHRHPTSHRHKRL